MKKNKDGFYFFTLSEFDSPDEPGSGAKHMSRSFIKLLDKARSIANVPFKINSGYRSRAHNTRVGSRETSSHRTGLAADIHCPDNRTRFLMIEALRKVGFKRIGIGRTFIHVDLDKTKSQNVIWHYYG